MLAELADYASGLPECGLKELPPDVAARMQGGTPPTAD
jgi:hypothetical protein